MSDSPRGMTPPDAGDVITEAIWERVFDRDQRQVARARAVAEDVVARLRREGLLSGTRPADSEGILAKLGSFGEAPARGISHLVAEALVLLDLPEVHRETLEALMPGRPTTAAKNTVAMQFRRALRRFANWGWITRSSDGIVTVLDRDSLSTWFTKGQDLNDWRASSSLDIAAAVARLNASGAISDADELRRKELLVLQRLMQSAPGAVTGERGQVRIVPKSRPL